MSGAGDDRPTARDTGLLLRTHIFDVVRTEVTLPGGRSFERSGVRHPGAIGLVVIDDRNRWLLVRQFRFMTGQELLEIPAGTRDPGEALETTAARELREETGFAADSLVPLGRAWMAPGFCDERMHFFLATGLRPDPLPQDDDEGLSPPIPLAYDELLAAIDRGEIQDGKTLAAVSLWERFRARERR